MSQVSIARPTRGASASPLARNIAVGAMSGIAAAWLMSQFQTIWNSAEPTSGVKGQEEPSTVKAADRLATLALGAPVARQHRPAAGAAVHYAFGAFVGMIYGLIGTVFPRVRAGFGTAYATAVELVADETIVPAAGLSPDPREVPLAKHAFGFASHLVFGAALEGSRRLVDLVLDHNGRWLRNSLRMK